MLKPDIGNHLNKSNELPLQLHDQKSIFLVTITATVIVTEFLSNYIHRKVIVSKYFPYSKVVIDYSSKYMVNLLNCNPNMKLFQTL